eukprot:1149214-Pelagomonas_calceolata.AAC.8
MQVEVDRLVIGNAIPLAQQRLLRHEFFRDCLAIPQVQVKVRERESTHCVSSEDALCIIYGKADMLAWRAVSPLYQEMRRKAQGGFLAAPGSKLYFRAGFAFHGTPGSGHKPVRVLFRVGMEPSFKFGTAF